MFTLLQGASRCLYRGCVEFAPLLFPQFVSSARRTVMNRNTRDTNHSKSVSEIQPPIDLSNLLFSRCQEEQEFQRILACRWKGYRKYGFTAPQECRDRFDEKAIHYLCRDCTSGDIVGCLRMLSASARDYEVETFVDLSSWLVDGVRPAELTRFSVPLNKRSMAIKFGLWKLAWADAIRRGHTHFLIWTKDEVKRNYDMHWVHDTPNAVTYILPSTSRWRPACLDDIRYRQSPRRLPPKPPSPVPLFL